MPAPLAAVALTEARDPAAAYQRTLDRETAALRRLEDRTVREVIRLLTATRHRIVDELLRLGGRHDETMRASQVLTARREVERALTAWKSEATRAIVAALRETQRAGDALQPRLLDAIGAATFREASTDLTLVPEVSQHQLDVAADGVADLVSRVSEEGRVSIGQALNATLLGDRSPAQAVQAVATILGTQTDRRGPIATQAERIVRTELLSVYNLANERRQREIAKDVPAIRKRWLSARDSRVRPVHAAATERYAPGAKPGPIKVGEDFVVGGERGKGPHAPSFSARNKVNCRCISVLWSPEWGT